MGLNEDLCEALSLAHDLGHTPFGHAGEDVLSECMSSYGGFDHNIQSLRILLLLSINFTGVIFCLSVFNPRISLFILF